MLSLNADGSFSYTPDGGFCGTDSFSYHANDGSDDSATANVTLTIAPACLIFCRRLNKPLANETDHALPLSPDDSGRLIATTKPSGSCWRSSQPPCTRATRSAIARPSPEPATRSSSPRSKDVADVPTAPR
ncbi:MAG: cadherin-like domain-containing protein [Rhodanobacteraceae bacterium]|nr:cadherin-like domain-containing protein [Rhodanobacteraceae bacterium]